MSRGHIKRRAYVCIQCEGVYVEEPVTECDCASGADIFWLAEVSYKRLDRLSITYAEWEETERAAKGMSAEG